jgi:hypothetical protein
MVQVSKPEEVKSNVILRSNRKLRKYQQWTQYLYHQMNRRASFVPDIDETREQAPEEAAKISCCIAFPKSYTTTRRRRGKGWGKRKRGFVRNVNQQQRLVRVVIVDVF